MAQITEVEPGDVLVFANVGTFSRESLPWLDEINKRLDVKIVICEEAADISVIRRVILQGESRWRRGREVMQLLTTHHYVSTHCQHALHEDCRKDCKICAHPCLCPCHRGDEPRGTTEDHEAWLKRDQSLYPATDGDADAVAGA